MTDDVETYRKLISGNLTAIENRLRALADKVADQQRWLKNVPCDGASNFSTIATEVMDDLMWGVANARLNSLISNAAAGDVELERARHNEAG